MTTSLTHKEIDDVLNFNLELLSVETRSLRDKWWLSSEEKERLAVLENLYDSTLLLWAKHNNFDISKDSV